VVALHARGETDRPRFRLARLCGAVDALCRAHGFGLDNEPLLIDTTRGARRALGEDAFDEEWAAGVELDLDAAVAFAVSILGNEPSETTGAMYP
jgi:hypothetical protein